eukprot:TRINITY_DN5063_c0_g1_i1.p1 TRINITY_DN5063_c0_g1~~TRINITY_DN5063_c0_g1_i1.p1  ORF type:complete len:1160 (-),score=325.37 TRINITY_DN5063_c0_g1_i1:17-3496(-)
MGDIIKRGGTTGEWKGPTAAGSSIETFLDNPQILIQTTKQVHASLFLFQGRGGTENIGFYLLRHSKPQAIKKYKEELMIGESGFAESKKASLSTPLLPGENYILIPCTFNPGHETAFSVSIFCQEADISCRVLESFSSSVSQPLPRRSSNLRRKASENLSVSQPIASSDATAAALRRKSSMSRIAETAKGRWDVDSAGGCFNQPSWKENPQYFIDVEEECTVRIKLSQMCKATDGYQSIGFYLIRGNDEELKIVTIDMNDIIGKTSFESKQAVGCSVKLEPSEFSYVIMPCTFEAGHKGRFTLSASVTDKPNLKLNLRAATESWSMATAGDEWRGPTAGGCRNHPSFKDNPQYIVDVPASCTKVIVVISQPPKSELDGIGLYVTSATGDRKRVKGVRRNDLIASAPFRRDDDVHCSFENDGRNSYNLIPCTFHPGVELKFSLTVYCDRGNPLLTPLTSAGDVKIVNKWNKNTAGGCYNSTQWRDNAHYLLTTDRPCTVKIVLEQSPERALSSNASDTLRLSTIGLYVTHSDDHGRRKLKILNNDLVAKTIFTNAKTVEVELALEPSAHPLVVMPCTYYPGVTGTYSLQVIKTSDHNANVTLASPTTDWKTNGLDGVWTAETAGGSRLESRWTDNPQFSFRVRQASPITVLMTQEADEPMGVVVLDGEGTKGRTMYESTFVRGQEATHEIQFQPGVYTLVPSLLESGKEGSFSLTLFSDTKIEIFEPKNALGETWVDKLHNMSAGAAGDMSWMMKEMKEARISNAPRSTSSSSVVSEAERARVALDAKRGMGMQRSVSSGGAKFNTIRLKPQAKKATLKNRTVKMGTLARGQHAKQKAARMAISKEILTTEQSFVKGLDIVVRCFFPLFESSKVLSPQERASLFGNIKEINQVNQVVLKLLTERLTEWSMETKVGDAFLQVSESLDSYIPYVCNYNDCLSTYEKMEKSKDFQKLLRAGQEASTSNLQLNDYLIMPIQRIPRYVMLLQELLKRTDQAHVDYDDIASALSKMREIAFRVNEEKRNAESSARLASLQTQISGKLEQLAKPTRKFVREGQFNVVDNGKQVKAYVFLFNDLLLITKKQKDKEKYALLHAVSLPPSHPINECQEGYFVAGILFLADDPHTKMLWLTDLRGVIAKLNEQTKEKVERTQFHTIRIKKA